jgi:hypothetical protein
VESVKRSEPLLDVSLKELACVAANKRVSDDLDAYSLKLLISIVLKRFSVISHVHSIIFPDAYRSINVP